MPGAVPVAVHALIDWIIAQQIFPPLSLEDETPVQERDHRFYLPHVFSFEGKYCRI